MEVEIIDGKNTKTELIFRGDEAQIIEVLKALVEDDFIDCGHEFTEEVGQDDRRYFDGSGKLIEESQPDVLVCKICGKVYNPAEESWQN